MLDDVTFHDGHCRLQGYDLAFHIAVLELLIGVPDEVRHGGSAVVWHEVAV